MAARGRHKIFLGMAPGVGKTYQMLDEGQEEKGRGREVVVGYLESHGRAETLSHATGLEILPRRRLDYRGTSFEEMDLPAIVRRRPQLCLIDELAHTNVPGCENEKRHQDVDVVRAAGIDVYSTVNVQHVESLANQIAGVTGIEIREILPDRVLDDADDVVLVDISPELLIERLEAGKIYPGRTAAIAKAGFFRPEKLAALREISLLEVAEEAKPARTARGRPSAPGSASMPVVLTGERLAPSRERVLALATPNPRSRPTVYHAFRTAERLHAPFDVLWVRSTGSTVTSNAEDVTALERLVSALGGTFLVHEGDDLVATAAKVADERQSTYLLIGQPTNRTALGTHVHRRLPLQLMSALPGLDLQIVALPDSSRRDGGEPQRRR
jgi:two-component system, OmpR family, sensor histidine kinase KdpD